MEFLDLLREAKTLGFSTSEFRAIWEKEMAIKEMAMKAKTLTELSRKEGSQQAQRFPDPTHPARPQMSIQESDPTRQQPADFCSSLATNTQQIRKLQTVAQSLQQQLTSLRTDLLNQNREALDTVIVPGYGQIKQELEKIRAQLAAIKQKNVTLKSELVSQQTILKKLIENMAFDLKHELEKDIKRLMTDVVHQYTVASRELTDSRGNDKRPENIQEEMKLGKSSSVSELKLIGSDSDETVVLKNDPAFITQENCLLVKSVPECCRGCGPEWATFKATITPSTNITSSTNTPNTNTPNTNTPNTNTRSTNTPSTNTPSTNTPSTNTSSTNTPSTNTPSTNTPSTNTPNTNTRSTNTPSTNTPNTNTRSTNTPSTNTSCTTNTSSNPTTELLLIPDMLVKIPNVSHLHATKGDYFSSPLYCTQLYCDIILRVSFTSSGYITVEITLLPWDRAAPPTQHTINSCGYILNSNSRGYSRLWSVLNARRDFPGESPTTIEPVLVLTTSKQNYYKITYQQLQEMGYVFNGCFHLKWSLDVRQIDSTTVTK